MVTASVPSFYLYGEPPRDVDHLFVHVESLDDRSRPSEWTIQPHAHAQINHVFLLLEGGGTMLADGETMAIEAPALVLVPANFVHGFAWVSESRGWVASLAESELAALRQGDPEIAELFAAPRTIGLGANESERAGQCMDRLHRELAWSLPGRRSALRALLHELMALAMRMGQLESDPVRRPGRRAALVARFRELVEQRYRQHEAIGAYAAMLGVSESTLRTTCTQLAGASPGAIIEERILLEARRSLLYTNLTVSETAYALGFADPAYFSRFFARKAGLSPQRYRNEMANLLSGAKAQTTDHAQDPQMMSTRRR